MAHDFGIFYSNPLVYDCSRKSRWLLLASPGVYLQSRISPLFCFTIPNVPTFKYIREIPNNLGGLNTEYLVTKKKGREIMGPNDITLGFGGGGSRLLKDILSHYADVSFQ